MNEVFLSDYWNLRPERSAEGVLQNRATAGLLYIECGECNSAINLDGVRFKRWLPVRYRGKKMAVTIVSVLLILGVS
jgi:hypothetical protein